MIDRRPPVVPVFGLGEGVVVLPAERTNSPPDPLFPDPTVTYTEPDRPDNAVPEPIYSAPEFPFVDVPELNTNRPDTPELPAFAV